jgi:hypothetical protein
VTLTFPEWKEVEPNMEEDWSAMTQRIGMSFPGKILQDPK